MLALCLMLVFTVFLIFVSNQKTKKNLIIILIFSFLISFFSPFLLTQAYADFLQNKIEKEIMLLKEQTKKEIMLSKEQTKKEIMLSKEQTKKEIMLSKEQTKIVEFQTKITTLTHELGIIQQSAANMPRQMYTIADPKDSRVVKALDARSQFPDKSCTLNPTDLLSAFTCEIIYAPIGLYSILLRPNPVQDRYASDTKLASLENLIFLGVLLWLLVLAIPAIRKRRITQEALLPLVFLIFSISGLALYEGNVGTSFRHRSMTVWAISLSLHRLIFSDKRSSSKDTG
jgi:hypothetical protein